MSRLRSIYLIRVMDVLFLLDEIDGDALRPNDEVAGLVARSEVAHQRLALLLVGICLSFIFLFFSWRFEGWIEDLVDVVPIDAVRVDALVQAGHRHVQLLLGRCLSPGELPIFIVGPWI